MESDTDKFIISTDHTTQTTIRLITFLLYSSTLFMKDLLKVLTNSVRISFSLHISRLDRIARPSVHSDDGFLRLFCPAISEFATLLFHEHNCCVDFIIRISSWPPFVFLKLFSSFSRESSVCLFKKHLSLTNVATWNVRY